MNETTQMTHNWQSELNTFSELGYLVLRQQFAPQLISDMRNWIDSDLEMSTFLTKCESRSIEVCRFITLYYKFVGNCNQDLFCIRI